MPPEWMIAYIRERVGRRAAIVSARTTMDMEIRKPRNLIDIEERHTTGKLRRVELNKVSAEWML